MTCPPATTPAPLDRDAAHAQEPWGDFFAEEGVDLGERDQPDLPVRELF